MSSPLRTEIESYVAELTSLLNERLSQLAVRRKSKLELKSVTYDDMDEEVRVLIDEHGPDDVRTIYGYRIKQEEIGQQSENDMRRAAFLSWLDIESELDVPYSPFAPKRGEVVWLMEDEPDQDV